MPLRAFLPLGGAPADANNLWEMDQHNQGHVTMDHAKCFVRNKGTNPRQSKKVAGYYPTGETLN